MELRNTHASNISNLNSLISTKAIRKLFGYSLRLCSNRLLASVKWLHDENWIKPESCTESDTESGTYA